MGEVGGYVLFGAFMFSQHFAGALDYLSRQSSEFCDFDAVALVGCSFFHFAQEDDASAAFFYRHVIVLDAAELVGKFR